jgi:Baseplate J-like protein
MSLPIDELFEVVTEEQARETIVSNLEALGVEARSWKKAGVASTIVAVLSRVISGQSRVSAEIGKSGFRGYAKGKWLDFLAETTYGVSRRPATFASGNVRLDNAAGGVHTYVAGEAFFLNPITKQLYFNTAAFSLASLQTGLIVPVQSVIAGSKSSSSAGQITKIETTMLGVACTNPAAVVGSDAAEDSELDLLCGSAISALSPNGSRGAYDYFARTAKRLDGSTVDINRVKTAVPGLTPLLVVYVASPSGAPSSPDLTAVNENIQKSCVPDGTSATVVAATTVTATSNVTIWTKESAFQTVEKVEFDARAAVTSLLATYPIGGISKTPGGGTGYLYADKISSVIQASNSAIFDIDSNMQDLALTFGEIANLEMVITVNTVTGI